MVLDVGVDFLLGKRSIVARPNAAGEEILDFRLDEDTFVVCDVWLGRNFVG